MAEDRNPESELDRLLLEAFGSGEYVTTGRGMKTREEAEKRRKQAHEIRNLVLMGLAALTMYGGATGATAPATRAVPGGTGPGLNERLRSAFKDVGAAPGMGRTLFRSPPQRQLRMDAGPHASGSMAEFLDVLSGTPGGAAGGAGAVGGASLGAILGAGQYHPERQRKRRAAEQQQMLANRHTGRR